MAKFQKGQIAFNTGKKQTEYMTSQAIEKTKATHFKNGHKPHNTNYDGHERLSKDGYIEIRIREGKYVLKHRHVWQQANGEIPKGMIVTFRDRNTQNLTIENLELITRQQNMDRNTIHRYPVELKSTIRLINKLKRTADEKQDK